MNMKNSILLLDPEFDPNMAPDCNLLLKITNDSFSYAIINQDSKSLKAVFDEQACSNMTQTLKTKIKNDPYLNYPYKEVKIAVSTDNCVTVPNELFNSKDLNAYINFFTKAPSKTLHVKNNPDFDFTSIFCLQQHLEDELDVHFKAASKHEQSESVLNLAAHVDNGLVFDFTALSFTAIQVENSKLIFKNTFEIESGDEFNYFLLLLIKQLDIDFEQTPVYISGIINDNDQNFRTLKKYFKNIQFSLPQNKEIDCRILEDMPAYYYSSLLAIDLCV
ncbi:DUF3822 family protein [Pedobacter immunditicola]|uniref:DUF3822 family protein n=1 Tax=Pedobacter immunditicola TaxID=3133440 RepID=UPI0030A491D1